MRRRLAPRLFAAALLLCSGAAYAHERFIRHDLKHPLEPRFFGRTPGQPLGVNINIWKIGVHAFVVLSAFLLLWFARQPIEEFVSGRMLGFLRGRPQRLLHQLRCFLTDRPVRSRVFCTIGEWAVIVFLRSPGLVLMYSAANDSLVMPSYPLEPSTAAFFKFAQVGLAVLILTQTLLPLCGALILGTWVYLHRWGPMVAVDAVPVLTVAAVYVTSPWRSHCLAITSINREQMRWVRLILGAGFFALGWLKVYNHNLSAGVPDNYPAVLNDPMVALLARGTDPLLRRECWIVSFGLAEVLSGFLLMTGTFTRVWCSIMVFVFTKLMLVDFGWEEIPHIYPIAALLAVLFSNKLQSEFDPIEAVEERLGRQRRTGRQVALIAGFSLVLAYVLIFPPLYVLSFFNRYAL